MTKLTTIPPAAIQRATIDPDRLRANMERFKANEAAGNTRKTYAIQLRLFAQWCAVNGLQSLPADKATCAAYVEHLFDAGKSRSTIDVARAAIIDAHVGSGMANPFADLGKYMRSVVRTIAGDKERSTPQVKPTISQDDLKRMADAAGDGLIGLRDRALILAAYAGWCRRGEPLKLRADAIDWRADSALCYLGATKTDQAGTKGEYITVPRVQRNPAICGYTALRAWLDAAQITRGPVFVKLSYGKLTGAPLTDPGYVNKLVEKLARRAGIDPGRVSPHRMFRASPITEAITRGESPAKVSSRARHKSFETTKKYVESSAVDNVAVGLAVYE